MQSLVTQPPPCTYTHTHTRMHAGTRMHTHMRTHTHAHTHTHTHTLLYSSPCEHMIVQEVHPHQHTCGVDNITNYHSVHRDNWAIQPMYSHTPIIKACCYSNGYQCACAVTVQILQALTDLCLIRTTCINHFTTQVPLHLLINLCFTVPSVSSLENFKAHSLFTTVSNATTRL